MTEDEIQAAAESAVQEVTMTFYRSELTVDGTLKFGGAESDPVRAVELYVDDLGVTLVLGYTDRDHTVQYHIKQLRTIAEAQAQQADRDTDQAAAQLRHDERIRGVFAQSALPSNWKEMDAAALTKLIRSHGQDTQRMGVVLLIERGKASKDSAAPETIKVHAAAAGGAGHCLDACLSYRDVIAAQMDDVKRNKLDTVQVEVDIGGGMHGINVAGEANAEGATVVVHMVAGGTVVDTTGMWVSDYDFSGAKLYVCSDDSSETTFAQAPVEVFALVAQKAVAEYLGA